MKDENTVEPAVETAPAAPAKVAAKPVAAPTVTSTRDVDFPSLGWGISVGATRDLPADPAAQTVILNSPYISVTK